MKYRKYILFAWDEDYPSGGFNDLRNSFGSIEEAMAFFESNRLDSGGCMIYCYGEIINRDTWEIAANTITNSTQWNIQTKHN